MPYQRRGQDAEQTPPNPEPTEADAAEGTPAARGMPTKTRKTIWIIGFAVGGYMIINGVIQLIMGTQT